MLRDACLWRRVTFCGQAVRARFQLAAATLECMWFAAAKMEVTALRRCRLYTPDLVVAEYIVFT